MFVDLCCKASAKTESNHDDGEPALSLLILEGELLPTQIRLKDISKQDVHALMVDGWLISPADSTAAPSDMTASFKVDSHSRSLIWSSPV
jgi:hypothetical protein